MSEPEGREEDKGSTFEGFARFNSLAEALNSPNLVAVNEEDPTLFYQTNDTSDLHRRPIWESVLGLPRITQASCTGPGEFDNPVVELPKTPGVEYTLSGEVAPGSTITITATALEGYNLPRKVPDEWVLGEDNATLKVRLQNIDCTVAVAPQNPTVTQAECTGPGTNTDPTINFATTTGITYSTGGAVEPGATVTVTAKPDTGYKLKDSPGWTPSGGNATREVTIDPIDCTVEAKPENPTVKQTSCGEPGVQIPPEVTPATTTGITYSIDGSVEAGSTVQVVATPVSGYVLTDATGWTSSGTSRTFEVVLSDPDCGEPEPDPDPDPEP